MNIQDKLSHERKLNTPSFSKLKLVLTSRVFNHMKMLFNIEIMTNNYIENSISLLKTKQN